MTPLPRAEELRTARQTRLPGFGPAQQQSLFDAHVLVIGAGGLGCPLMQSLAATGVGHITVIDDDVVSLNNIHRQILFTADDVGRRKVDVVAQRLVGLQPSLTVTTIAQRFDADNAVDLLRDVDILVDGSDNFATKFLAADAAEVTGTPLVWGTVLQYRGDVALWWTGPGAPAGGAGLRDLFPAEPDPSSVPDCATAGVLGVTTSVVGSLMATEVVTHLTGLSSTVGVVRSYDALAGTARAFRVRRDPQRAVVTRGDELVKNRGGAELLDTMLRGEALAIDVREADEKAARDLPRPGRSLPTSQWEANPQLAEDALREVPEGSDVVVYCASGARSRRFVERFADSARARGVTLHSLPGGANAHGVINCRP
ncbi:putative adenylyltransferase/sulfurtransferase MoeZ [Corynebacterium capitovis DSM 44611]|uniref:ThiF family adenylyltransferase n=1 Tax=Corynebacterium capitovis TaxID=131081 RepID=UPI00037FDCBA|nr:ThiF family adenylyltransferase [Corynebacterium capitovis]WKD57074.1 putative adenylyltransferase/sulfurtransferase MoeZ [Corynebacterium capitovis DSM 44611]